MIEDVGLANSLLLTHRDLAHRAQEQQERTGAGMLWSAAFRGLGVARLAWPIACQHFLDPIGDGETAVLMGRLIPLMLKSHLSLMLDMVTAGLYEHSGQWLYDVGLPGKSGVAGGIVTVSPGKGGVGTFSPPLDAAGNSVRGQRITRYLSEALGLNLFASAPTA